MSPHVFSSSAMRANIGIKLIHVPRLHIDSARPGKAAHQTLSSLQTAHGSATSLFHSVVAAPGYQVTVVDNVLLARLKLLRKK